MDAARWCKGCNLVIHRRDGMVDEHGTHRKSRPIHAVGVDAIVLFKFGDGRFHEVDVFRSTNVPSVTIASQVGNDEFCCVNHRIELVGIVLVFWTLVHTVSHNHQWHA